MPAPTCTQVSHSTQILQEGFNSSFAFLCPLYTALPLRLTEKGDIYPPQSLQHEQPSLQEQKNAPQTPCSVTEPPGNHAQWYQLPSQLATATTVINPALTLSGHVGAEDATDCYTLVLGNPTSQLQPVNRSLSYSSPQSPGVFSQSFNCSYYYYHYCCTWLFFFHV